MMKIYNRGIFTLMAACSVLFFTGCQNFEYLDENLSSEGSVVSLKEASIELEDPKYQECYAISDVAPQMCSDQTSSNIVLAQDLVDYMYARTDEQPYLFTVFAQESQIIPDPSSLDENQTMGTPPNIPILMDLDREVSCIHYIGDDRAINIEKFKCFVEKYSNG